MIKKIKILNLKWTKKIPGLTMSKPIKPALRVMHPTRSNISLFSKLFSFNYMPTICLGSFLYIYIKDYFFFKKRKRKNKGGM
jgi:hypothetical protein